MSEVNISEYIDLESALGRVRGNRKLYARMLGMFTGSEEFGAFEQAIKAGDLARAGEVAHGIKGITGNLGFTKLFDTSNELMVQLRAGSYDAALLESYYAALEGTRASVQALLPQLQEG